MHNTVPLRSPEEVASNIGKNVRTIVAEKGLPLEWLACEIGIDVSSILKAFATRVETWMLFDLAFYLEVAPDRLLEPANA
jgi:hypothetical protein